MKYKQIAIYGAGGFAREVAWLALSINEIDDNYQVVCFIDDNEENQGQIKNNIPIMGLEKAREKFPNASIVGGIGSPKVRQILMEKAEASGFSFETLIHPHVDRSQCIEIGEGTVICAGNILTTNITIGRHVQINLDCTIGHDVIMDDYTTLAPGVHVSGWVHFGKRVYVGTGAVIINGTKDKPLSIGDDAIIGAGACVTKPVPSGETWGGYQPGHYIKNDNSSRFKDWKYPNIKERELTDFNWMVQYKENLKLGFKTDIGAFTYINAKNGVIIEDYVEIGSHCSIYSVSTIDDKKGKVILKERCKLGSHSVIMPGVTIGKNSIVGAFSFVNEDIPDNVVALGVPAKVVKKI